MDEHDVPDGRLAGIYLEASYLHERALTACMEELGDTIDPRDPHARALLRRALLHAERAAACAADAANSADSAEASAVAKRSLVVGRLAVMALHGLMGDGSA
jgi:hypothetical protein